MMEPKPGFGSPCMVAGYFAALVVLASIAAASRSLAPAVALICSYVIICNTYASMVLLRFNIGMDTYWFQPLCCHIFCCLMNYAHVTNTATSILTTPRTLVAGYKGYGKTNSIDTIKGFAPHLALL